MCPPHHVWFDVGFAVLVVALLWINVANYNIRERLKEENFRLRASLRRKS